MAQVVPDVEAVMVALTALLTSLTTGPSPLLATLTRKWQPWDQLDQLAQPALVIVEPEESEVHRRGQQSAVTLDLKLVLYAQADYQDNTTTPSTVLNNLIKGIRTALLPSGSGVGQNEQTLGGLVSACYISGKVRKDAGILDNQMSALIPVTINIP